MKNRLLSCDLITCLLPNTHTFLKKSKKKCEKVYFTLFFFFFFTVPQEKHFLFVLAEGTSPFVFLALLPSPVFLPAVTFKSSDISMKNIYIYFFGEGGNIIQKHIFAQSFLKRLIVIMVMMNPDICEWQKKQTKKNKRITVTDEEKKCVKECYCSVRNISKMNIIIAFISVRCIFLGRRIKTMMFF